jgi:hypothetical protein
MARASEGQAWPSSTATPGTERTRPSVSGTTLKKPPRGAAAARVGVLAASPFQGGRPEGGARQGKEGLGGWPLRRPPRSALR